MTSDATKYVTPAIEAWATKNNLLTIREALDTSYATVYEDWTVEDFRALTQIIQAEGLSTPVNRLLLSEDQKRDRFARSLLNSLYVEGVNSNQQCRLTEDQTGYVCTREKSHPGPLHVAHWGFPEGGESIVAWDADGVKWKAQSQ